MEDYSFSGLIAHFLTPLSFALFHLKVTQLSQFSVFSMEFSGKLQMVFCFFPPPPWKNHAHSGMV